LIKHKSNNICKSSLRTFNIVGLLRSVLLILKIQSILKELNGERKEIQKKS